MTAYDVFDWLEMTWIGQTVRDSLWLFPVIESVHLLALSLLGGAVLIVDFRLLGLGITQRPVAMVERAAAPWLLTALVVLVATGVPLFLSEAIKCYFNTSFWVKMIALAVGLIFTYTVRRSVARRDPSEGGSELVCRLVGAASMAVWFTVAAAGRWIGFS